MSYFFITFAACFTAIILFWLTIQIMETRVPVTALFRDRKFYYLAFIHGKAVNMLLDGKTEKSVLEELKQFNFPFTIFADKKSFEDLEFIRELVKEEDLVKRYLLQQDFDYKDFRRLCQEFGSPIEDRKRAAYMAIWTILPNPTDKLVEKVSGVFVELMTPPFIGSDGDHRISAGENESNVFFAAKDAKAIKSDCTKTAFVDCIWKLKQFHGKMEVVKGKQGLTNHSDKPFKPDLNEKLKTMIENALVQDKP